MTPLDDLLTNARDALKPVLHGPGRPHYHHAFPHGSECYKVECDWIAPWAVWAGQCVPGKHTCGPMITAMAERIRAERAPKRCLCMCHDHTSLAKYHVVACCASLPLRGVS